MATLRASKTHASDRQSRFEWIKQFIASVCDTDLTLHRLKSPSDYVMYYEGSHDYAPSCGGFTFCGPPTGKFDLQASEDATRCSNTLFF